MVSPSTAEARAHILEGLLKALDFIDEVIQIIRSSSTVDESKRRLMERFGFTELQANAIVEMRLRQLCLVYLPCLAQQSLLGGNFDFA